MASVMSLAQTRACAIDIQTGHLDRTHVSGLVGVLSWSRPWTQPPSLLGVNHIFCLYLPTALLDIPKYIHTYCLLLRTADI